MNKRKAMVDAVVTNPGIDMRAIATILGITDRDAIKSLAAQLSQLCQTKKLRKDSLLTGDVSRPRYWPTDTSTQDLRRDPNRAGRRSAAAKVSAATRSRNAHSSAANGTQQPKPETRAELRLRMKAERGNAPRHGPRVRTIAPPRIAMKRPLPGAQTVEQFMAAGGRVQVLAPHEASNPLRFDHSQTQVPMASRRPSTRCRPAPGR